MIISICRSDYKDYQLESRVHFRINAGMQKVKRMENDWNKKASLVNTKSNEI